MAATTVQKNPHYEKFIPLAKSAENRTALGVALLVPALLLLIVGSWVLKLQTLHFMDDYVIKVLLPSACGIILSIPFFYSAVDPSNKKRVVMEEWHKAALDSLLASTIPDEKEMADYIYNEILPPLESGKFFRQSFLQTIQEGCKQAPNKELLDKAFTRCLQRLMGVKEKK